jgi:hypothetical protein
MRRPVTLEWIQINTGTPELNNFCGDGWGFPSLKDLEDAFFEPGTDYDDTSPYLKPKLLKAERFLKAMYWASDPSPDENTAWARDMNQSQSESHGRELLGGSEVCRLRCVLPLVRAYPPGY